MKADPMMNKDWRQFQRELLHRGWKLEKGRKCAKWYPPNDGDFITTSLTPSCCFALRKFKNMVKHIESAGALPA